MSDFVRKFMDDAEKHQKFINQMAEHWKNKAKNIDIKDMHFKLSAGGCRYADLIIQNEKYINRYTELQNEGKSDIEIAYILDAEIEKENKPYRFPWLSALALLYPIGAIIYITTQTPANIITVMGCGLANLGYLLFGAGIFAGKFRIFGLKKRWQVFITAFLAFLIGTLLTNINI